MAVMDFGSTEKLMFWTALVVPFRVTKLTLKSLTVNRLMRLILRAANVERVAQTIAEEVK